MVGTVQPGGEFGDYRIHAVEREDANVAVLRATEPEGRAVSLHVAGAPPGSLSTVRFLERAHRLGGRRPPEPARRLRHAHARRPRGRGRRGARGPAPGRRPVRGPARVGAGDPDRPAGRLGRRRARGGRGAAAAADRRADLGRPARRRAARRPRRPPRARGARGVVLGIARPPADGHGHAHGRASSTPSSPVPVEGAYLSAGQFADELRRVEDGTARRRREIALTVLGCATLLVFIVLLIALG